MNVNAKDSKFVMHNYGRFIINRKIFEISYINTNTYTL